jgi:hypothetical protein
MANDDDGGGHLLLMLAVLFVIGVSVYIFLGTGNGDDGKDIKENPAYRPVVPPSCDAHTFVDDVYVLDRKTRRCTGIPETSSSAPSHASLAQCLKNEPEARGTCTLASVTSAMAGNDCVVPANSEVIVYPKKESDGLCKCAYRTHYCPTKSCSTLANGAPCHYNYECKSLNCNNAEYDKESGKSICQPMVTGLENKWP